jgi:hypothetical protein
MLKRATVFLIARRSTWADALAFIRDRSTRISCL